MTREELRTLEAQAAQGDAESQYLAGCARHDDVNLSLRHLQRALRWLRLASDQGHIGADRRLGYIYVEDVKALWEGVRYYRRAADRGDVMSMCSLGVLHGDRYVFPALYDPAQAVLWHTRALEGGSERNAEGLGIVLLQADFDGRDPERGAAMIARASANGFLRVRKLVIAYQAAKQLVPLTLRCHPAPGFPDFPFEPARRRLLPELDVAALEAQARTGSDAASYDLGLVHLERGEHDAAFLHLMAATELCAAEAPLLAAWLSMTEPSLKNPAVALRLVDDACEYGLIEAHRVRAWFDAHYRLEVTPL